MEAIIQVKRGEKFFVATDLITYVVDQGKTKEEAVKNLKVALREHYKTLFQIAHQRRAQIVENLRVPQMA